MFGWILAIVGILIFMSGISLTAWMHGKGELAPHEVEGQIMVSAFVGLLWPIILAVGLAVSPFVALYYGIKHYAGKHES